MSTAFFNPNEAGIPPGGMLHKRGSTNAKCNLDTFLNSHLLSLSNIHDGHIVIEPSAASDDDLVSAAQRGDQRAFVELCSRYSGLAKQKIFKIVRNHEDTEDALQ